MAELGNLTYNVTINDEVTKELEQLRDTVNNILNRVEALESKNSKRPSISINKSYDDYLQEWKTIISESSLGNGKLVCCGMGVGIGPENKMTPFIVQDGQVYINQATIKDATIRYDNGKKERSCWLMGKNGQFEMMTNNHCSVKIDDGALKVFDENGTLRVRVQL